MKKDITIKTIKQLKEFLSTVSDDAEVLTWDEEEWEMHNGEITVSYDKDSNKFEIAVR